MAKAAKKKEAALAPQAAIPEPIVIGAGVPVADWQNQLSKYAGTISTTGAFIANVNSGYNFVAPVSGSQSYTASSLTVGR